MARYKAKFVAQRYFQISNINFNKTIALSVQHKFLTIFLVVSILLGLLVKQIDIIGIYLENLMDNNKLPIFIKLSPEIQDLCSISTNLVYKLLKSIYSLKQSGQLQNQKVIGFLKILGFKPLNTNFNILISIKKDEILLISIYIDNFFFIINNPQVLQWFKYGIYNKYNVKNLREICIIIKWQIIRNHTTRPLKIDHFYFIQDLIKNENMTDWNLVNILTKASYFIKISKLDRSRYQALQILNRKIDILIIQY